MAKICNDLEECAQHIQQGNLVAFPTETVYGLGANALDVSAVYKIFEAKKRPLSDPVIVHVSSLNQALGLTCEEDEDILRIFSYLATSFWPGPLTLVVKSGPLISPVLTANTGYVGLRHPNHPIARELIEKSGLPIAAPSANLFSHVSPTSASHVIDDFADSAFPIKVIDGDKCTFGIESTVAKIFKKDSEIVVQILRRGGVSEDALREKLAGQARVEHRENYSGVEVQQEAPGQMIKHYSPHIETYLLDVGEGNEEIARIEESVVIGFNYQPESKCKALRMLSVSGSCEEAINNLYECLRWAETQDGKIILMAVYLLEGPHAAALWDRIYRSTSGRRVVLINGKICLKA